MKLFIGDPIFSKAGMQHPQYSKGKIQSILIEHYIN